MGSSNNFFFLCVCREIFFKKKKKRIPLQSIETEKEIRNDYNFLLFLIRARFRKIAEGRFSFLRGEEESRRRYPGLVAPHSFLQRERFRTRIRNITRRQQVGRNGRSRRKGACHPGFGARSSTVLCIPNAYRAVPMHRMHGQLIYSRNKPPSFSSK